MRQKSLFIFIRKPFILILSVDECNLMKLLLAVQKNTRIWCQKIFFYFEKVSSKENQFVSCKFIFPKDETSASHLCAVYMRREIWQHRFHSFVNLWTFFIIFKIWFSDNRRKNPVSTVMKTSIIAKMFLLILDFALKKIFKNTHGKYANTHVIRQYFGSKNFIYFFIPGGKKN